MLKEAGSRRKLTKGKGLTETACGLPEATTGGVLNQALETDPPRLLSPACAFKSHPPTRGLDLGMGKLDWKGKELRPNVTANHPHEASG